MKHISDKNILAELKYRFEENAKNLNEQTRLMEQLRLMNAKLEESEKSKTLFLSNIRNEINNPLTSALGLVSNLMGSKNIKNKQEQTNIKLVYEEILKLNLQLNNIFVAAEAESGEILPTITQTKPIELIISTINSIEYLWRKKDLKLDLNNNLPHNLVFSTDAEKLHIVLSNVLANAIEYSELNGKIDINTSFKKGKLKINIQDFGIGISKTNQEIIFDRFKQLDVGTTKSHYGHGLGLSVSRSLLENIDGDIKVQSKLNKGSTFTITLIDNHDDQKIGYSSGGNEFLFDDTVNFTDSEKF